MYRFLLFLALALPSLGFGQIFEIKISIENMDCPYCSKAILAKLEKIPGVTECRSFESDGSIHLGWMGEIPFQSAQFFKLFRQEKFTIQTIDIDVEGQIEEKKGVLVIEGQHEERKQALILYSEPDTSFFYISDCSIPEVKKLRSGDLVRLRGRITLERGNNMLMVEEIKQ